MPFELFVLYFYCFSWVKNLLQPLRERFTIAGSRLHFSNVDMVEACLHNSI